MSAFPDAPPQVPATSPEVRSLGDLYRRKARVLRRRPGLAWGAGEARVQLGAGLACRVETGARVMVTDLYAAEGGADGGPHPMELLRASLGASLATGYKLWAARAGTRLDAVEVVVHCHHDARGQLLADSDVTPGWQRLLLAVTITTPAPAGDVAALVALANRRNPVLAMLSPAIEQVHRLTVVPSPPPR
jgi:uncharacterized OsmC-like protein